MKKIVFFNTKGGTGKTTICYNYGWYLAEKRNKKILFMDFDPQINLTQSFYKTSQIKINNGLEKLVVNYINKEKINFKDYIIKINENIDLLPSSNNISLLEEYITDYLLNRTFNYRKLYQSILRNKIIKDILDEYINEGDYDYVVIDSQPNYSLLSITSIIYSKNIIAVLKPELFSFLDLKYLNKIIESIREKFDINVSIVCIIINAFEKRKKISKNITDRLMLDYGDKLKIINQKIRYLSHYQSSISSNKEPVFISYPNSEASDDLIRAFNETDILIDSLD
ncbi:MAG: ParA family protein [Nitrososphaeraceae archaeon]